ncbi:MAG: hypothetical protein HQK96_06090 [Nitrospirae bacterium]|nr:hypothetical protein [Nitrospirota bacterium]
MNVILSIKPKYAAMIYDGNKTVELRRYFPVSPDKFDQTKDWVYLYESSPVQAITGKFSVSQVTFYTPYSAWLYTKNDCGIAQAEYDKYFAGTDIAYALYVEHVIKFVPIPLNKIKKFWQNFRPPQNYRYMKSNRDIGGE